MPSVWSTLVLPALFTLSGLVWLTANSQRNPYYVLDVVDEIELATRPKVEAYLAKKVAAGTNNNCTLANARVRREWADLTVTEREEYAPKDKFPDALTRYYDFVTYHMTHASELHDNYHLFPAHKHFLWAFEEALRNECGYKGTQPYMNYDGIAKDLVADGTGATSLHFNENSSCIGGTGLNDPNYKGVGAGNRVTIPAGGGGGCIVKGHPFSDFVVSLGPTTMASYRGIQKNPKPDGTGENKRCLRRDLNKAAALGATAAHAYRLMTESDTIDKFYNILLGTPPPKNDPYPWGIHTAGHYINAVDPGGDAATSPGDPVFHFHHAALDRLWWMWQMQDPDKRLNAVPMYGLVRVTDPNQMMVDLKWLTPVTSSLMESHEPLGGNKGHYCYVYI
ncbi:hypothetical protein B0T18DRAFT_441336 [Schizothecium vesticola]|uniref:Tyrosinase copper-binding domain-containing protein n=1 Tax=Schizothecium vesticola TaxID=314040 RepID=A0AA40BQV3_9PEZI|nr:hypothetical protein B0T18DRAFT_441336 [Schizothecium vesticola]